MGWFERSTIQRQENVPPTGSGEVVPFPGNQIESPVSGYQEVLKRHPFVAHLLEGSKQLGDMDDPTLPVEERERAARRRAAAMLRSLGEELLQVYDELLAQDRVREKNSSAKSNWADEVTVRALHDGIDPDAAGSYESPAEAMDRRGIAPTSILDEGVNNPDRKDGPTVH